MEGPVPNFAVLSPKDDHEKPWITNLLQELRAAGATVELLDASNLKWEMNKRLPYCIINRVRDSAPCPLGKNVGSFLRFAEAKKCIVINGSFSYAIGNSKVNQHTVLETLGLATPRSIVISSLDQLAHAATELGFPSLPVLLKPDEGGMGNGIVKFTNVEDMEYYRTQEVNIEKHKNGFWLVQEYISPSNDDLIYRVWVTGGKVHCAITTPTNKLDNQCFNSCMCTLQKKPTIQIEAIEVDHQVEQQVQQIMKHCQSDVGSVEYFIHNGQRLYFDVNMLSTLPDPKLVNDPRKLWSPDFNPWKDLASYIIDKATATIDN